MAGFWVGSFPNRNYENKSSLRDFGLCLLDVHNEAGCSQEEGPKKGFVMGSRTQGVQEILEKYI